jgi:Asp-tRNA(Asn)/Glu-tRNA(Gln) amidotransferase A subunit family amidase
VFDQVEVILTPTIAFAPPQLSEKVIATPQYTMPIVQALVYETCAFKVYGAPVLTLPSSTLKIAPNIPFSLQAAMKRQTSAQHLSTLNTISSDLSG